MGNDIFDAEARRSFSQMTFSHLPIRMLGEARIDRSTPYSLPNDAVIPFVLDGEMAEDLAQAPYAACLLEACGPKKHLFFEPDTSRFGIVTCGGLCPGINEVIRSIVMEASHNYHVDGVIGIPYGLEGFIESFGHELVPLTPDKVSSIHQFGGTMLGTSRGPQDPAAIVDALLRWRLNALFMVGGDGTMKAAAAIAAEVQRRDRRIAVIGIPKTIDNDINFISQSFGFETAVYRAAEAIQSAHTEALGVHNGIGLVKLMGRESGFIAAHATLASKEVNFVLIPEAPFSLEGERGFLAALRRRLAERKHAVIVVAEGAGQHLLQVEDKKDASGNPVLSDIASFLKTAIHDDLTRHDISYTLKYIDPSYMIRSVPANANDKVYCGLLGQNAVHAAMAGKTDMVVAKVMDRYVHLPLELVTRKRRKLDIRSEYWRSVLESTGQGDLEGMRPV